MRVSEIELEGFRSFEDRVIIRFPESGMVLINGRWAGTEQSSASGKSSIPMAIAYVLGFCDLPTTDLRSWHTKKFYVRLRLVDRDNVIDVIRDPKLKIIENGIEYKGLTKGGEERLREILKTPPELLHALTYRQQREKGKFLTSTDTQNKEFLSTLLGLTPIEEAGTKAARDVEQLQNMIQNTQTNLARLEQTLAGSPDPHLALPAAEEALAQAQTRYTAISSTDEGLTLQAKANQIQAELQRISRVNIQATTAETENNQIRLQMTAINKELQVLSGQICPTCHRDWDKGYEREEQLKLELSRLIAKAKGNMAIIASAAPMIEALPGLQAELGRINMAIGQLKAPVKDAAAALAASRQVVVQLQNQIRQYSLTVADLANYRQTLASATAEEAIARHVAEILSRQGFLSAIFDECLQEIEHRANEMVGQVPNVSTLTLAICSAHETKSGSIKKTIAVKILKDGHEVRLKGLSGGQQCSLELCVDLAVSETIRNRSGSPTNWIILDEAMDGLENENKQAALAMIRRHISGTIIVIDHSSAIKESFDQVVSLQFDGRKTSVVEAA